MGNSCECFSEPGQNHSTTTPIPQKRSDTTMSLPNHSISKDTYTMETPNIKGHGGGSKRSKRSIVKSERGKRSCDLLDVYILSYGCYILLL